MHDDYAYFRVLVAQRQILREQAFALQEKLNTITNSTDRNGVEFNATWDAWGDACDAIARKNDAIDAEYKAATKIQCHRAGIAA